MKRFHVHLAVPDLRASIEFYTKLFGAEPAIRKDDYAKWMLDDPRLNFAISSRGARSGLNHLGLQADSPDELADIGTHFSNADSATAIAEPNAHCCYALSDKHWVQDPQGIRWEAFHSLDSIPMFGAEAPHEARRAAGRCGSTSAAQPVATTAQSRCCEQSAAGEPAAAEGARDGCCS